MTPDLVARLRALASYTTGDNLVQRLVQAESNMAAMREGLTAAAEEIERLRAELKKPSAPLRNCATQTTCCTCKSSHPTP